MSEVGDMEREMLRMMKAQLSIPNKAAMEKRVSNCAVILSIPIDSMSESDFDKLLQAEKLLRDIGVAFDRGAGNGSRDWFMDETMIGAWVRTIEEVTEDVREETE